MNESSHTPSKQARVGWDEDSHTTSSVVLYDKDRDLDPRHIWATIRGWMELDKYKQLREGGKKRNHWDLFESLVAIFGVGVKACGLWQRGYRNALDI